MNKLVLFSFLALTMAAGAEEVAAMNNSNQNSSCDTSCCKTPCTPLPPLQINRLTSAAPASCNGWYVFAAPLYWHADEGGTDWASKNSNTTLLIDSGPNHAIDFKWSWGFQVGLGMTMAHDEWDSNVHYTWWQTSNSNAVGTGADQLAADLVGIVGTFSQGNAKWGINFRMLDWELGRAFYVSPDLALRPRVGVKGGFIDQKVRKSFTTSTAHWVTNITNRFWGVGPSGGLGTEWVLGRTGPHKFSLMGDFGGALMYGHFTVKNSEISSAPTPGAFSFNPTHLNKNLGVPMLEAMIGLSWDMGAYCDCFHFGLDLGYDFQYWFNQNQMITKEIDPSGCVRYLRAQGNMSLQGLNLAFRFDF